MSSKAYLMGERYCNQEMIGDILSVLANKPPKRIIGIAKRGANTVAYSIELKAEEIKYPAAAAH
jgi:hypothetical protein